MTADLDEIEKVAAEIARNAPVLIGTPMPCRQHLEMVFRVPIKSSMSPKAADVVGTAVRTVIVAPMDFVAAEPGPHIKAGLAAALKRTAERSRRRKASPYRSALSMLIFYINRAGENLPATNRKTLERAKIELRKKFKNEAGRVIPAWPIET